MTNNSSHNRTTLKWNKNGDLDSGDMFLTLEKLKNKDLKSCSLLEIKDFQLFNIQK